MKQGALEIRMKYGFALFVKIFIDSPRSDSHGVRNGQLNQISSAQGGMEAERQGTQLISCLMESSSYSNNKLD